MAVYHLNLAELGLISSGLSLGMTVRAILTGFLVDGIEMGLVRGRPGDGGTHVRS